MSVPVSEVLERCGLLGAGERRTRRGASLRAEEYLCREEGVWHGERGRQGQAARQQRAGEHLVSQPTSPCLLQVAGTKGPGSPGSGKTG